MDTTRKRLAVALIVFVVCLLAGLAASLPADEGPQGGAAEPGEQVTAAPMPAPTVSTAETRAAESKGAGETPQAAPAYRIEPGDTLSITVLGVPEYSGSFPVRADGTIMLQDEMIGAIVVGGRTAAEASDLVTGRIAEYIKDPKVLLEIGRFKVMVVGEVLKPGQYDLSSGARLMDAVQRSGGPKEDAGLARVYLTKVAGTEARFNLRDFTEKGDETQNPLVEPGDRVSVGKTVSGESGEYKVTGAVAKPGSYYLDPDEETRVSDAVKEAGRWTTEGDPRKAQLFRKNGPRITLDLTTLDQDVGSEDNLLLRDGDELFVPRNTTVVNVLGGVQKPGPYNVPGGTTLLEVISMAGGLQEGAILKDCAVVRSGPQAGRISADLERLMKQGDMTQNPVLEDRDVVFVPARPPASGKSSASTWQVVTDNAWRFLTLWRWRYW